MHYYKPIQVKFLFIFCLYFILNTIEVGAQHFTTARSGEGIEISENGRKVLFYQVRPKSVEGKYERAGFVHPLYSLNQKILTDDSPADHPYHRGIFWAWHQIILNGKNIADGWMSEHISWVAPKVKVKKSKGRIMLQSEMVWNAEPDHTPTPIVKEKTKITVFKSTLKIPHIGF